MVLWFQPTIKNALEVAIRVAAISLSYGKCYDINHPYDEVQCPSDVVINPGSTFTFGASSREESPTGTEGTIDLVFDASGDRLANVYWDSPWAGPSNTLAARDVAEAYTIDFSGFNYDFGPLGSGHITVIEN